MSDFESGPNKASMRRAMCYIPLVAIVFSVVEKDNVSLKLDIRYGIMLFLFWILASIIWKLLGLWTILFLLYLWGSWYLAFKAYNNEEIKIWFLDQAFEAITWKIKK